MTDTEERNLAVVHAWVEAWNRRDFDAATAMLSEDFSNHGRRVGKSDIVMRDILTTFPDQRLEIQKIVATGDDVIFRAKVTATHLGVGRLPVDGGMLVGVPPTGKTYSNQHIHWFTLKDGLIVEHRANRDDITMMVQLGLLPSPPAFGAPARG